MTNANTIQSMAFRGPRHRSPAWKRWLSVQAYGLVTRSLFPAHGSPLAMRARFERFARTPREKLCRKYPELVFEDYSFGDRGMEAVKAVKAPSCVLMHLHGGAVLFSPWTDMSVSGASYEVNDRSDVWLSRAHCETWAGYCVGDVDPRDPRVSPMYANLDGLPPMLVLVGDREVLFDDARQVHEHALAAGIASTLHVGRQMQHDWPLTLPWLDESRDAWSSIAAFAARFSGSENDHPCIPIG